jgi:hypothetical protein
LTLILSRSRSFAAAATTSTKQATHQQRRLQRRIHNNAAPPVLVPSLTKPRNHATLPSQQQSHRCGRHHITAAAATSQLFAIAPPP